MFISMTWYFHKLFTLGLRLLTWIKSFATNGRQQRRRRAAPRHVRPQAFACQVRRTREKHGRRCTVSRIHGRWVRLWRDIRNGHQRRVPRVEQAANVTKLDNCPAAAVGGVLMVITEWGAFDNGHTALLLTPFYNKVGQESINPRFQAY
ncbi:hypothetical protein EDB89DRAFT_389478 [Lactarius sanguifluus]|nr:hypothetical protein EDB89DRAFT_389478 [Lactarius sanguifluus]